MKTKMQNRMTALFTAVKKCYDNGSYNVFNFSWAENELHFIKKHCGEMGRIFYFYYDEIKKGRVSC